MRLLSVTKPGIIFGNTITCLGGFLLATRDSFHVWLLLCTLVGMGLVIACGCIINNLIDRDIDKLMKRTQNRVLVKGLMSAKLAVFYAILSSVLGFVILYWQTNPLTTLVALIGLIAYVGVYTLWLKRSSVYGTAMGGIAGAVPPVVGYCAVTNQFDWGAVSLFLILFFWQMSHFYAIAIYRLQDYTDAAIPVLPVKRNVGYTKVSILIYLVLFVIAAISPTLLGYAGWAYGTIALILSLIWLGLGIHGFKRLDSRLWARRLFAFSILLITLLSLAMIIKM